MGLAGDCWCLGSKKMRSGITMRIWWNHFGCSYRSARNSFMALLQPLQIMGRRLLVFGFKKMKASIWWAKFCNHPRDKLRLRCHMFVSISKIALKLAYTCIFISWSKWSKVSPFWYPFFSCQHPFHGAEHAFHQNSHGILKYQKALLYVGAKPSW
jgi:hypothetical protein